MTERSGWRRLRDRRMGEPGAGETYAAARVAFELGKGPQSGSAASGNEPSWAGEVSTDGPGTVMDALFAEWDSGRGVPAAEVTEWAGRQLDCAFGEQAARQFGD